MKVICLYLHLSRFCFFLFLSIYLRILLNRCALSTEHAYSWTDRDHRVSAFLPLLCAFFFVSVQWVCTTLFWSVRHHAMCVIVVTSNGNWICMLASFSWKWITCYTLLHYSFRWGSFRFCLFSFVVFILYCFFVFIFFVFAFVYNSECVSINSSKTNSTRHNSSSRNFFTRKIEMRKKGNATHW